jgi:hypothetical protein
MGKNKQRSFIFIKIKKKHRVGLPYDWRHEASKELVPTWFGETKPSDVSP